MSPTSHSTDQTPLWKILVNRLSIGCIAVLSIQQLIEASSTLWLVTMMRRVTEGEPFFLFLFLYLTSLATPYIPGCIASIIKISWKQEAQKIFIHSFVEANHSQVGEWNNKSLREEKLSLLTAEGPAALSAFIDYLYDLYYYFMSVAFSIITLSIVIEPLFAIAYTLGIIAVLIVMQMNRRRQRKLTQKALTARIDLYQALLAAWDNVLLGNDYNFRRWLQKTDTRIQYCLKKNMDLERFDQLLAIGVSLLISLPCLGVAVHYIYVHQNSVPDLSAFFVTLPILFVILYNTYLSLSLIFRWAMHKSKLVSIHKALKPILSSQVSMQKKIKWDKIQFFLHAPSIGEHRLPIHSLDELLNYTHSPGRLTIRGENGAGKSTLLILIKHHLQDNGFFLPTQHQLSFQAETNKHSTGESLKNRLIEISEKVQVGTILLDEWDANLDADNRETLTDLIDILAENKCVIEVRHR